ncbi:MAG: carbon-nitrogen hydrolase family protein [Limibacillus sp.]|jgi:predicted amidohydrolase
MSSPFTVGLVQMNSGPEIEPNIESASAFIREAAAGGAKLIVTPENTTMIETVREKQMARAYPEEKHPGVSAFSELARELGVWLSIGSMTIGLGGDKAANRSFLFGPDGGIAARYDKVHMFDVEVPDGQTYRESATFRPGEEAVLADLPWGRLGITICYDIRFPYLYRALAKAGASFITTSAAFTEMTGKAHWHVLQRARAIETGCFIFAAAQTGEHTNKRRTYGHSLVVAPWGEVLADGGTETGVVLAEIDPALVAKARSTVPSLENDRPFELKRRREAGE